MSVSEQASGTAVKNPFEKLQYRFRLVLEGKNIVVYDPSDTVLYHGTGSLWSRHYVFRRPGDESPLFSIKPGGFFTILKFVAMDCFSEMPFAWFKARRKDSYYMAEVWDDVGILVGTAERNHRDLWKERLAEVNRLLGTTGFFKAISGAARLQKERPELVRGYAEKFSDYYEFRSEAEHLLTYLQSDFRKEVFVYQPQYSRPVQDRLAVTLGVYLRVIMSNQSSG